MIVIRNFCKDTIIYLFTFLNCHQLCFQKRILTPNYILENIKFLCQKSVSCCYVFFLCLFKVHKCSILFTLRNFFVEQKMFLCRRRIRLFILLSIFLTFLILFTFLIQKCQYKVLKNNITIFNFFLCRHGIVLQYFLFLARVI